MTSASTSIWAGSGIVHPKGSSLTAKSTRNTTETTSSPRFFDIEQFLHRTFEGLRESEGQEYGGDIVALLHSDYRLSGDSCPAGKLLLGHSPILALGPQVIPDGSFSHATNVKRPLR